MKITNETKKILSYFEYDVVKNISMCKIVGDNFHLCGKKYAGRKAGNLKRHILTDHAKYAEKDGINLKRARKEADQQASEDKLNLACIKMVCENHIPFHFFDSEAFKMLMDPIIQDMNITINSRNIPLKIGELAGQVRDRISAEVQGKMISLKVDGVSKLGRSVLGINMQMIVDQKIVVRTLGMPEMKERHTSSFITSTILSKLATFGIGIGQIYSCTSDNGANMIAAANEMTTLQDAEFLNRSITESGMPTLFFVADWKHYPIF